MFYNAKDGGQCNVPIEVVGSITFNDVELYIIAGGCLLSEVIINGEGVLVVEMETVTANQLANIIQLHR